MAIARIRVSERPIIYAQAPDGTVTLVGITAEEPRHDNRVDRKVEESLTMQFLSFRKEWIRTLLESRGKHEQEVRELCRQRRADQENQRRLLSKPVNKSMLEAFNLAASRRKTG